MGSTPGSVARRSIEVTLKGKAYVAYEPDIDELALFESHIKSTRLDMFLKVSESMDATARQETISNILKTPIENEEIQAELTTLDGVRYMTYLILKENPGVTLEGMRDIVDLSNISEVIAILDGLGGEDVDPQTATPESP